MSIYIFLQDHPAFPHLLDLLWDKGFALCYKEKFHLAYAAGSNVLNISMRTNMLGSDTQKEHLMSEDLCTNTGKVDCKCAEGALDFLGNEWGPPPTCLLNLKKAIFQPEVFSVLCTGLPEAAQAVTSAPAGAFLSANLS